MWFWLKISICESSVVHEGCCVNCSTRVGNLEAVGLLKRIHNTGTIVWQPGSDWLCLVHISGGPCAQLGGQAKKAQISSWDFAWNRHSLFKCTQDNSPWSPAQMIQTTSCSAVVWSQLHLPSHHHHHIQFWYLWCCGCPGLRGRQHLATPHTRSPWIPV